MSTLLSGDSIVVAGLKHVSCDLGGEAAVLNLRNSIYYGLDGVGARIWELIQQPRRVKEIQETLLSEYDVDRERCERDLLALLEKFLAEGLIEVKPRAAE